ncbi:TetR family transcriptional regulator [Leptospira kobayashii]|uniref:TetR family transcriptional regulator n=1 Tax=Leptospira kobayashii TaxID=1917830 RepID=A0ABN6K994_9LEPT|nr:TetR/AcrR family transcriptional regulator [Leptospira kobayashii]BDA77527.1 TetR family transcriptional regulator [Leptospira kobayashii]
MDKQKPKERILSTTKSLFYRQGYDRTGINQILEESRSHKQSLYQYFPSKQDLGKAYLEEQRLDLLNLLRGLSEKKEDPKEWIAAWVSVLKRQARKEDFFGCPFANFSAQSLEEKSIFQEQLQTVIKEWILVFETNFDKWKEKKYISPNLNSSVCAKKSLVIYEGNIQLFLITGNKSYLESIESDFLDLIREPVR